MKVLPVNVGLPREIVSRGRHVRPSIWKVPVEGPVRARKHNLDGDRQSALTVHGGSERAVYVYPSEHCGCWSRELPDTEFPAGAFGENLTTEGVHEEPMQIGTRLRIGATEFLVTQPRMPCL